MMRDTGIGHIGIQTLSNTVSNSCSVYLTDINISRITTRAPKIVSLALKSMKLQCCMHRSIQAAARTLISHRYHQIIGNASPSYHDYHMHAQLLLC
jgi:hypothetical protein